MAEDNAAAVETLNNIRQRLDSIAEWRLSGPLSTAEHAIYGRLCECEERLIAQRQLTPSR